MQHRMQIGAAVARAGEQIINIDMKAILDMLA